MIIAAPPRSEYDKHPDYFGGRQVIKGRTVELVKQSELVLLHCSTSISFSVLFRKPMLFITSDSIRKSFYGPDIDSMAGHFDKTPINLDNSEFSLDGAMEMDEDAYSAYQRNYIKYPGTPELPFWRIVADRLKAVN